MNRDLKTCTQIILYEADKPAAVNNSIEQLHQLFAQYSGVSAKEITDKDIILKYGKAISTTAAAHCLIEYKRTAVFLRGIFKAIQQLRKDNPSEKINILYAGCGPYATLLTPFTSLYSPEEIGFYLLDINENSLAAVRQMYNGMDLNNYLLDIVNADATCFTIPAEQNIHMVVSETMLYALREEPQVSVMLNLIPQMPEKSIFIPQEIRLSLKLLNENEENKRLADEGYVPIRKDLANLYFIGRHNCKMHEPTIYEMPQQIDNFNQLNIFTDIHVYADEWLTAYDSSLNTPYKIANIDERKEKKLEMQYLINEDPGFSTTWLS